MITVKFYISKLPQGNVLRLTSNNQMNKITPEDTERKPPQLVLLASTTEHVKN